MSGFVQPLVDRVSRDIAQNARGCFNAEDFTRIEKNAAYLAKRLDVKVETKDDWQPGNFIYNRDFERWCIFLERIQKVALEKMPTENAKWEIEIPQPPINSITKANTVERILLRAARQVDGGHAPPYCGDVIFAGEAEG